MSLIKIVTDSTTDLPKALLEQNGVEVIPLSVYVDGNSYLDNVTISPEQFLEKMQFTKELPKTSQPSTGAFLEAYNRLGANGETIISIHMTSGMSGTYASAVSAAEMTTSNVIVIDSQMISHALAFQVIEAAEMARNGQSSESIVNRMKDILHRSALYVVVLNLENLIKGGRIGRATGWIGTLLNLKPIAMLKDGVYTPITRVRSTSQIVATLIERFAEDCKHKLIRGIGISHANNLALAQKLEQEIAKITNVPVRITPASPVITTHTGPGAIGFMYYTDNS